MNTRRFLGTLAGLLLVSGLGAGASGAKDVRNMPFRIAGGTILQLPATDGGPLPAENDDVKIDVAGVGIVPSKEAPHSAALLWGFDFTAKTSLAVERVVVEEVAPSDPARVVAVDEKPVLKNNVWSATTPATEANASTTPWLYGDEDSIFVFRFTITLAGRPPMVMYQPSWFAKSSKATLRQLVDRINAKAAAPADGASQGQRAP